MLSLQSVCQFAWVLVSVLFWWFGFFSFCLPNTSFSFQTAASVFWRRGKEHCVRKSYVNIVLVDVFFMLRKSNLVSVSQSFKMGSL